MVNATLNMDELLSMYALKEPCRLLAERLRQERVEIYSLDGLAGSSAAVVAAAVYRAVPHQAVFILPERESAAYFFNDLENLLPGMNLLFFPASAKKPWSPDTIDRNQVLMRTEVQSRLTKSKSPFALVTYAEAIHEKAATRQFLIRNTMEVHKGESLSIEFVNEFLEVNGFERSDFVFEPGQFSIRGGILDVFSFAHDLPYRIEFAGHMIESIRCFNPLTQLSENPMQFVTLVPDLKQQATAGESESFFHFIPASSVLWMLHAKELMEALHSRCRSWSEPNLLSPEGTPWLRLHEDSQLIEKQISGFKIIQAGGDDFFPSSEKFLFHHHPQPSFNKNFDLLSEDLHRKAAEGYRALIVADAAKQIDRLHAIFEDLEKKRTSSGGVALKTENLFSSQLLSLHEGFVDTENRIACYTDHQVFNRYHRYKLRKNYTRSEALTLKELYSLKPGDFITHIDHGVGRFGGLETQTINGKQQETIRLVYKDNDILYISIHALHRIARYTGKEGTEPVLNKLGSPAWSALKQKTKKRVKDIAKDLIALYAKRKTQQGFAFHPDNYLQHELEASFIYEDTPDQVKATRDVKKDMESPAPMDRLICGDVGFGKTEIAIRAAFKAASDGKQAAVLVPTTILALQHYRTFSERLKAFPCSVDYLNRFKSSAQQNLTIKKLKEGKTDIIIGTHRLLSKDISFKDLGLLIVDEEQKFGVAAKEKIKALRTHVDTLTLTATPIPRTLQFSLMGARDLSIIHTPPPNRFPVTTEIHTFNEQIIRDAVAFELARGGQVFFIHNRIQDIRDLAGMIKELCPDARIAVGHGQMEGHLLEEAMLTFINGDTDVLVSTTIVESGLDISNANTIIINQAQNFGLSDLHQMRGRVGRSNKHALCYLLTPPFAVLTAEARQRLRAIEEFSDLGSGFNIAMRDLDIRGAGNLLGGEQSGFISEIGFEMYHKILDEAIRELKENEFKDLFPDQELMQDFVSDCQIESDLEIIIPQDYVESISERLVLYKELDDSENETQLTTFRANLQDRFGPVPAAVDELLYTIRLRWKAKSFGFEKILLKNGMFKGYLVSNKESGFYKSPLFGAVIRFVQQHAQRCQLKEEKGKLALTVKNIASIREAIGLFSEFGAAHEVKSGE